MLKKRILDSGYTPIRLRRGTKEATDKGWNKPNYSPYLGDHPERERWGVRCGDYGLIVIDIDAYNADDPEQFLDAVLTAIEDAEFPMENTIQQRTLSDGVHLFLRTDSKLPSKKLAYNSHGKTIIETKGVRSYVVVYRDSLWEELPDLPVTSTEDQVKLYDVLSSFDERKTVTRTSTSAPDVMLQYLSGQGWTVTGENDNEFELVRPGPTENKKSAVVYKDSGLLFCWTSSTMLPAQQALSLAKVQSILEPIPHSGFQNTSPSMFDSYSVSQLIEAAKTPQPPMMLNHLARRGELTVLFSPTGVGKSTLALQLAVNVARGTSIHDELLPNAHPPAEVLYVDLENSKRIIAQRIEKGFEGQERLTILKPKVDADNLKDPAFFMGSLIQAYAMSEAALVVIDNLSCIYMDGEKKSEANKLITPLHELAQQGPAVVCIAHTPKRLPNTPITLSDLAGSAQFGNRPDHIFALNKTNAAGQVYLIEFKAREDEKLFEHDVILMEQATTEYGRGFEVIGLAKEHELLTGSTMSRSERDERILELNAQGKSIRDIAELLNMGKSRVHDIIKGARG